MNHQPLLKICGITRLEDARYAAGAMVDFIGFIFYPGSPRCVTAQTAAEIINWINGPLTVGVFVNQTASEINEIIDESGIDLVQLHGEETPDIVSQLKKPVIKVFRIQQGSEPAKVVEMITPWIGKAAYLMFDTFSDKHYGGTGDRWDWNVLSNINTYVPFFLAGGVTSANVAEAVRTASPFAIDLSSSVESSPGVKDFDKLQEFFDTWNDLLESGRMDS